MLHHTKGGVLNVITCGIKGEKCKKEISIMQLMDNNEE